MRVERKKKEKKGKKTKKRRETDIIAIFIEVLVSYLIAPVCLQ